MKILLIYPYCLEARLQAEDVSVVPQGVYYIAALLKKHAYDVQILNWHAINKTPQQIKAVLLDTRPDLIGFSILHANRWGGIEIARIARQVNPDAICDLDQLPIPAQYFSYQHVSLTRGCAGNCKFCGSAQFWGRKVRSHSPDYFVAQLELLYNRGSVLFMFPMTPLRLTAKPSLKFAERLFKKKWRSIGRRSPAST